VTPKCTELLEAHYKGCVMTNIPQLHKFSRQKKSPSDFMTDHFWIPQLFEVFQKKVLTLQ